MEDSIVAPWGMSPTSLIQGEAPRIHNGKITIINSAGEYRTFQIKTQKKGAKFAPGKRVVALLAGPDNQFSYQGFGFVDSNGVSVWQSKQTKSYIWFAELINVLVGGFPQSVSKPGQLTRYTWEASKRCLICNRELTTPESLHTGIGPVCAAGY